MSFNYGCFLAPGNPLQLFGRRKAQEEFLPFVRYTFDDFEPSIHHDRIAYELEQIEKGLNKRLAIFLPPRHSKSELVSRRFPAWFLGKNPDKQMIFLTYANDFAEDFGRDVQEIMNGEEYARIFDARIRQDVAAAGRWRIENRRGVYRATGIGGQITGRGADVLIIDDPHKNREEADQEWARKKIWDSYRGTIFTRLQPNGAIILVQTRWHDDDLASRILRHAQDNDEVQDWTVLKMPALCEETGRDPINRVEGAALWPKWYNRDALLEIKATIGEREFSAQYQQSPTIDSGDFFQRDWLRYYDTLPPESELRFYGASDYATQVWDRDWETPFLRWLL